MLRFFTYDVFTRTPYAGNPLAIVRGADALSAAQMQRMAREFNLSETIFVQAPVNPSHTARVRIFFPTAEIPFAGHPTIGCAILLATEVAPDGDFVADVILEEEAGIVPVVVTRKGPHVEAEFTAPVIPHAAAGVAPVALIAAALGLDESAICFGGHRPGIWQGGPAFLYVPLADLTALLHARPQEPAWSELMDRAGVDSAYLYTAGNGCDFQARMFSPHAGIPEDPATGSASAILAAQLRASRALPVGKSSFVLRQGVEMGRPSTLFLNVDNARDGIEAIRIRGAAVPISQGSIAIPHE